MAVVESVKVQVKHTHLKYFYFAYIYFRMTTLYFVHFQAWVFSVLHSLFGVNMKKYVHSDLFNP